MIDITITCNCCGNKEHNSFNSIGNAIEYLQKKSKQNMSYVYGDVVVQTGSTLECNEDKTRTY